MVRAAVIGTGFIGGVHAAALRRIGAELTGVLGSSPERGAEGARRIGTRSYDTLDDLLSDEAVDVVHVASPNDAHHPQTMAALEAGKHVVCEKPLSMTAAQSAELVSAARQSGRIAAVCYNMRFHPLNQHAHGMIEAGELGEVRLVTGRYHQDWLALPTDWNWRLTKEAGGDLRSVGDIGTHWADLTCFITGMRPTEILAELATFIPERRQPVGSVETFAAATGETRARRIDTDDAALILMRYPNGAKGAVTISQVSHGHRNTMGWDIAGSEGSAAWDTELPDHLWLGRRGEAARLLPRDPALMNGRGAALHQLPPGHTHGYADTFPALFTQVYDDIRAGRRQDGSRYAGFEDGHWEMLFCEAVLESARSGAWTRIEA